MEDQQISPAPAKSREKGEKHDKTEMAEKLRSLLEPSGVPAKDSRLIHLLEMELTLKAQKLAAVDGDAPLAAEIEKKLSIFVARCALAARHYMGRGDDESGCGKTFEEKLLAFGTEASPFKDIISSDANRAKLYSESWEHLAFIYEATGRDPSDVANAKEAASTWQRKLKQAKRTRRLAKAKMAARFLSGMKPPAEGVSDSATGGPATHSTAGAPEVVAPGHPSEPVAPPAAEEPAPTPTAATAPDQRRPPQKDSLPFPDPPKPAPEPGGAAPPPGAAPGGSLRGTTEPQPHPAPPAPRLGVSRARVGKAPGEEEPGGAVPQPLLQNDRDNPETRAAPPPPPPPPPAGSQAHAPRGSEPTTVTVPGCGPPPTVLTPAAVPATLSGSGHETTAPPQVGGGSAETREQTSARNGGEVDRLGETPEDGDLTASAESQLGNSTAARQARRKRLQDVEQPPDGFINEGNVGEIPEDGDLNASTESGLGNSTAARQTRRKRLQDVEHPPDGFFNEENVGEIDLNASTVSQLGNSTAARQTRRKRLQDVEQPPDGFFNEENVGEIDLNASTVSQLGNSTAARQTRRKRLQDVEQPPDGFFNEENVGEIDLNASTVSQLGNSTAARQTRRKRLQDVEQPLDDFFSEEQVGGLEDTPEDAELNASTTSRLGNSGNSFGSSDSDLLRGGDRAPRTRKQRKKRLEKLRLRAGEKPRGAPPDQTQAQTQNQTQSQTQGQALNQTQSQTQNQALNQTQSQTQNQALNQTQSQTQNQALNQTQSQTQNQTQSQTQSQTQNQALNQTQNQTQNQALNQTQNQNQTQAGFGGREDREGSAGSGAGNEALVGAYQSGVSGDRVPAGGANGSIPEGSGGTGGGGLGALSRKDVLLGPALPDGMLADVRAAGGREFAGFDYLDTPALMGPRQAFSHGSAAGFPVEKVAEATLAVSRGREAQFRLLAREHARFFTPALVAGWLRVAVCAGSPALSSRLVRDFGADPLAEVPTALVAEVLRGVPPPPAGPLPLLQCSAGETGVKTRFLDLGVSKSTASLQTGRDVDSAAHNVLGQSQSRSVQEGQDRDLGVLSQQGLIEVALNTSGDVPEVLQTSGSEGRGRVGLTGPMTLLHLAAVCRKPAVALELLKFDTGARLLNASDALGRTALHWAAALGDEKTCQALLSHEACGVTKADVFGNSVIQYAFASADSLQAVVPVLVAKNALSPLYPGATNDTHRLRSACEQAHEDVGLLLLEHTAADIDHCDDLTPLHWATVHQMERLAHGLLLKGAEANPISSTTGQTPLHMAAATSLSLTKRLISFGADPGVEDPSGNTALHYACRGRQEPIVAFLLTHAPKLAPLKNRSGATALHVATTEGLYRSVGLIVATGGAVDGQDSFRNTALHMACSERQSQCAAALVHAGAGLDVRNHAGVVPLMYACDGMMSDVAVQLVTHGCKVNVSDQKGYTALHYACANRMELLAFELLKSSLLDVCARSRNGVTVLHLAAGQNLKAVASALLTRGCNIGAKDGKGNTPLHYACLNQSAETAELLISLGAAVTAANKKKQTPLDYAILSAGADYSAPAPRGCAPLSPALSTGPGLGECLRRHDTADASSNHSGLADTVRVVAGDAAPPPGLFDDPSTPVSPWDAGRSHRSTPTAAHPRSPAFAEPPPENVLLSPPPPGNPPPPDRPWDSPGGGLLLPLPPADEPASPLSPAPGTGLSGFRGALSGRSTDPPSPRVQTPWSLGFSQNSAPQSPAQLLAPGPEPEYPTSPLASSAAVFQGSAIFQKAHGPPGLGGAPAARPRATRASLPAFSTTPQMKMEDAEGPVGQSVRDAPACLPFSRPGSGPRGQGGRAPQGPRSPPQRGEPREATSAPSSPAQLPAGPSAGAALEEPPPEPSTRSPRSNDVPPPSELASASHAPGGTGAPGEAQQGSAFGPPTDRAPPSQPSFAKGGPPASKAPRSAPLRKPAPAAPPALAPQLQPPRTAPARAPSGESNEALAQQQVTPGAPVGSHTGANVEKSSNESVRVGNKTSTQQRETLGAPGARVEKSPASQKLPSSKPSGESVRGVKKASKQQQEAPDPPVGDHAGARVEKLFAPQRSSSDESARVDANETSTQQQQQKTPGAPVDDGARPEARLPAPETPSAQTPTGTGDKANAPAPGKQSEASGVPGAKNVPPELRVDGPGSDGSETDEWDDAPVVDGWGRLGPGVSAVSEFACVFDGEDADWQDEEAADGYCVAVRGALRGRDCVFEWTVTVIEGAEDVCIGVCTEDVPTEGTLEVSPGAWVAHSNGYVTSGDVTLTCAAYGNGDTVTVSMNTSRGVVSFAVNGKKQRHSLRSVPSAVAPAISFWGRGRVSFSRVTRTAAGHRGSQMSQQSRQSVLHSPGSAASSGLRELPGTGGSP
ncbi:hypothetical protein DIPPA_24641 [Diplonema papillatum]|nr:hypothetical protein DIPPA_24641 [Diplonema papillatum]